MSLCYQEVGVLEGMCIFNCYTWNGSCWYLLIVTGMKVLYKTFPHGMLTGEVSASCKGTPLKSSRSRKAMPSSTGAGHRPVTAEHRECFTLEDLENIQDRLDDALLSGSRASSRTNSSTGHRSSASSRQDSVTPWK